LDGKTPASGIKLNRILSQVEDKAEVVADSREKALAVSRGHIVEEIFGDARRAAER
jgi:hypothetical protein